jgi:hypothetical protein
LKQLWKVRSWGIVDVKINYQDQKQDGNPVLT